MSQTQLRGISSYMGRLQTKYLAEAGINYAKGVLEFDAGANKLDSQDELWRSVFAGSDVDIDDDGTKESKWFNIQDDQGNNIGRYAVLVRDEAAKVNINGDEAIIRKFFDSVGLSGQSITDGILKYRYGSDQKPGVANTDDNSNKASLESDSLDNDGDGIVDEANEGVDEPQEFSIEKPRGDDRPFVVVDELKKIEGITSDNFKDISGFITVSSKDHERDAEGSIRQNINYIKPDNLIKIMLDKGVSSPWQKAVNTIDSLDRNLSRTKVYKHYNLLSSESSQASGSWIWANNHYECDIPGGTGVWTWYNLDFSDGEYYCYIYGIEDDPIGDVKILGKTQSSMQNGDAFVMNENRKVTVAGGVFSISIENNEDFGQTCYFSSIELVPEEVSESTALLSKEVHGVEAIRINEIMVSPKIEKNTVATQGPGGAWVWQSSMFVNADSQSGQQGEGRWIFTGIPNGYYYLRVSGQTGEFVGDVEINGRTQSSMRDGDYFTESETVYASSNQLVVTIQNNLRDKTCYFKGIILSQQPDAEYIELLNISNNSFNLSGWAVETTGQEAAIAFIPQGTTISPYDYLVLCVDKDDTANGLSSNHIAFVDTWGVQKSVQLDFLRTLDRDFDFLKDVPVEGENFIVLRNEKGLIVDAAEYLSSQVSNYSSLERGDPTEQTDSNRNSEFDGWFATSDLSGGTPGRVNDNLGMQEDEFYDHDIHEVIVRNAPITVLSDLMYVPKTYNWERYTDSEEREEVLKDLSLITDSLTLSGILFSPKEHNVSGWIEISGVSKGFYSDTPKEEGVWKWEDLENGDYFLTISGEFNEALTVSYKKADGSWQVLSQGILPNEEGLAFCGVINIGSDKPNGTEDNVLEIKLQNESQSEIAHFYSLRLDPGQNVYGRININTAPQEVLLSLPNVTQQSASDIIKGRPFGNKDGIYKGVGDLFLSNVFGGDTSQLGALSNYVTVRSNVFEIIARAQVLDADRVIAQQEIKTIIER
ncbi:MAG: type II secretion system protein GspK [Candidatus Omnitrophica bacterium]|nr:type II secretion system protein GspK [Candidatus Omnitrophota bacterium]